MRTREFQRAAAAAFLPAPAGAFVRHIGGVGKIATWLEHRVNFLPRGSSERAAEAIGGAGFVKAAAAGTAIVAAGGALAGHLVHDVAAPHAPQRHPAAHIERRDQASFPRSAVASAQALSVSHGLSTRRVAIHDPSPAPPNKSLGYLTLGGPSERRSASHPSESSSPVRATTASAGRSSPTPTTEPAPQPTQSGGGTSLSYLGK